MIWLPEYGIGCLVLTNSEYHSNSPWHLGSNVLRKLVIEKKLIDRRYSFDASFHKTTEGEQQKNIPYVHPDPDSFTRYKSEWKKYIGTYKYMMNGWKFETYAQIGLALGYSHPELQAKVYEKNGFLEIDGERLDEHLPGLFFTDDGECLDFRGDIPTWQNYRMKRK